MSAQIVSYSVSADPDVVAKIEAKRERASKPCCMRCGKILAAKRDLRRRVCFNRQACTQRAICSFRAPKFVSFNSQPNHTWRDRV